MSLDRAVNDMVVQRRDARGRCSDLHTLIEGGDPPRIRSAAAATGHAEAIGIHVGTRHEVVEPADAVPSLDASRRVTAGNPPPASF